MKIAHASRSSLIRTLAAGVALSTLAAAQRTLENNDPPRIAREVSGQGGRTRVAPDLLDGGSIQVDLHRPRELSFRFEGVAPADRLLQDAGTLAEGPNHLRLAGGTPGSLALVVLEFPATHVRMARAAGQVLLSGTFDVRGEFVMAIPGELALEGVVAHAAEYRDRSLVRRIDVLLDQPIEAYRLAATALDAEGRVRRGSLLPRVMDRDRIRPAQ